MAQPYETDASKEYVIRGNSVVVKCQFPSFVADFLTVVSWKTDKNEVFYPNKDYGNFSDPTVLESHSHKPKEKVENCAPPTNTEAD